MKNILKLLFVVLLPLQCFGMREKHVIFGEFPEVLLVEATYEKMFRMKNELENEYLRKRQSVGNKALWEELIKKEDFKKLKKIEKTFYSYGIKRLNEKYATNEIELEKQLKIYMNALNFVFHRFFPWQKQRFKLVA